jgi:putative FmdB family regulatory protein
MPCYEYECDTCGHRFERVQKADDRPVKKCPQCHNPVRKVFFPVAIIFRGSGFYVTDYGRGNNGRRSKFPDSGGDGKSKSESKVESKTEG